MFGMLDYRAHKLYIILFGIPNFILVIFSIFAIPLINYFIGLTADERIYQIVFSLIAVFPVELIFFIIFKFFQKFFWFIFELFIDVIPHDGRNKEEAQYVVMNGEKGIYALKLSKHPSQWTDSLIREAPKNDWVINIFFNDVFIRRLKLIRDEYLLMEPDAPFNDSELIRILVKHRCKPSWQEKVFGNKMYRRFIVTYSFFLYLLIYNPFG